MINVALGWIGYVVECFRIDQVAAGVFEQSRAQLEMPQRTPLRVAWAASRELLRKLGIAFHRAFERCLIGEKQITQQLFGGLFVFFALLVGERILACLVRRD